MMKHCLRNYRIRVVVGFASGLIFSTLQCRGDLTLTLEEVGTDLQFSVSGAVDLNGLTFSGNGNPGVIANFANTGTVFNATGNSTFDGDVYVGGVGDLSSLPIFNTFFTGGSTFIGGELVSWSATDLYLPIGYVSNSSFSASGSLPNTSLSDLGLSGNQGASYSWNTGSETERVIFGTVPEPSAFVQTGLAIAVISTVTRRRTNLRKRNS